MHEKVKKYIYRKTDSGDVRTLLRNAINYQLKMGKSAHYEINAINRLIKGLYFDWHRLELLAWKGDRTERDTVSFVNTLESPYESMYDENFIIEEILVKNIIDYAYNESETDAENAKLIVEILNYENLNEKEIYHLIMQDD